MAACPQWCVHALAEFHELLVKQCLHHPRLPTVAVPHQERGSFDFPGTEAGHLSLPSTLASHPHMGLPRLSREATAKEVPFHPCCVHTTASVLAHQRFASSLRDWNPAPSRSREAGRRRLRCALMGAPRSHSSSASLRLLRRTPVVPLAHAAAAAPSQIGSGVRAVLFCSAAALRRACRRCLGHDSPSTSQSPQQANAQASRRGDEAKAAAPSRKHFLPLRGGF